MTSDYISFKNTGYFSKLICDYLEQIKELQPFYSRFPSIKNIEPQIKEKKKSFPLNNRKVLSSSIFSQYKTINASENTVKNITALTKENTFTITTGHQLNLFTGPLYFLYKIISTINLTEEAKKAYPENNFVPVYWMATEDHDFLEINHFQLNGKKIVWNNKKGLNNANGYVGKYNTEGLSEVFSVLEKELGIGNNANYIKELFKKGYLEYNNLTDATRYIVNELFGKYGLVIVDGDDRNLKKLFLPIIEQELSKQNSFKTVTKTTKKLNDLGFKAQVTPREINLFYGVKGLRERIEQNNGSYKVINTNIKWDSFEKLKEEFSTFPERFSPNVILRPVYQEIILPNLCYIGGGGELAYWFQLKESFKSFNIPFPMLLLRNSALLISKKQHKKLEKLSVAPQELFMKQSALINYKVRQISNIEINFSKQKKQLFNQFEELRKIAKQTDITFLNAVNAQEKKQIKGLEHLEKRLLKAQRIKLSDQVNRLTQVYSTLFPQQSLQERKMNFSEFYLEYGDNLISILKKELQPLNNVFIIIKFE